MGEQADRTMSVDHEKSALTKKLTLGGVAVLVLGVGLSLIWGKSSASSHTVGATASGVAAMEAVESPAPTAVTSSEPGVGMAALQEAAQNNKYLFAFFWKAEDSQTLAMRKIFDETMRGLEDRADAVAVCITDAAERDIVSKFQLTRAPMPLVLALAPNGAITGGFPSKFSELDLLNAFASPTLERCMKALQDGKLVLLCAQNESTTANTEALAGVRAFESDARFSAATEVVMLDPRDSAEASFLNDLKIDSGIAQAVTALLVPPGSVVAEFQGATTKEELMAALQNAGSCGPGGACGPGGCAPQ